MDGDGWSEGGKGGEVTCWRCWMGFWVAWACGTITVVVEAGAVGIGWVRYCVLYRKTMVDIKGGR